MPAAFRIPYIAKTGRNADITIGQVVIAAGKFGVNVEGADIDIRCFALVNSGFSYGLVSMLSLQYNFDGAWNFAANPAIPPRIVPDSPIDDVKLWLRRGLEKYTIPESRILTGASNVEMDALINYAATGKASGSWFYPGDVPALGPDV